MPTKMIKGMDLYYEEYKNSGAKDTFILIHGFLSSTFSFRKLVPLLRQYYHVVSVDLPPFGKSGKHHRYQYSYHNLANSVMGLIKSLGYQDYYLVGHSMGGQIALNIILQDDKLVKKAILLCSSGYLPPSKPSLKLSSYIPFFQHFVKFYLERSGGVKQNLENVVFDHSLIDSEMLTRYEEPFLDKEIFKGLTRMIRDREGDLASHFLQTIKTPCLLIWGEHDRVVPLRIGRQLKDDLPNSELVVIKDAGHLIAEEKPDEVFQYIQKFI